MPVLKTYTYIQEDVNFGAAAFVDVAHNLGTSTGIPLAQQKIIVTPRNASAALGLYLTNINPNGFRVNSITPFSALVRVQVEVVHSVQQ